MMRFRKSNPVRDLVGAIVFALAATLLWVESSTAGHSEDVLTQDDGMAQEAVSIRSAVEAGLDRL